MVSVVRKFILYVFSLCFFHIYTLKELASMKTHRNFTTLGLLNGTIFKN